MAKEIKKAAQQKLPVPHLMVALAPVAFLVGALWLALVFYKD